MFGMSVGTFEAATCRAHAIGPLDAAMHTSTRVCLLTDGDARTKGCGQHAQNKPTLRFSFGSLGKGFLTWASLMNALVNKTRKGFCDVGSY